VSGSIETSVFKVGTTQAVGGAMIFKPTYKISSLGKDKKSLVLEEDFKGMVGSYVWLVDEANDYKTKVISEINGKIVGFESLLEDFEPFALIDIGRLVGYY
jgi:hypothetical protein